MAIQRLGAVPRESLVGKFVCAPSRSSEQVCGWPAIVEKTTASRLTCVRLPRGEWDPVDQEWQVRPTMARATHASNEPLNDVLDGDDGREDRETYNLSSVRYVFDTAHEAIALYTQAIATRKTIEAFRKDVLAQLDAKALAGELTPAPYLTASQPN